jgi:CheY-like chemotaxis protein
MLSSQSTSGSINTVLVVDDDADVRSAVGELLNEEGFAVCVAENGRVALDLLERGLRPQVVLLDLMMPVMDGWDFRAQQLRSASLRDLPVIIITAAGFSAASMRMQFGDLPFVPKPPDSAVLLSTIKSACGKDGRES